MTDLASGQTLENHTLEAAHDMVYEAPPKYCSYCGSKMWVKDVGQRFSSDSFSLQSSGAVPACDSRGGRPGLPVPNCPVSVDVKQY